MRKRGKALRTLHETEQSRLVRIFHSFDVEDTGVVDVPRFCGVWETLGVRVAPEEAAAVFNKYGQDRAGRMPYRVRCSLTPPQQIDPFTRIPHRLLPERSIHP